MKRSSIATLRNTIAFMICRAMKTVMNVPVRAHVAMMMTFDLSMLEMSGCCYCMIAWTVSVEDSNEDYSKHTPFPSHEVRPTVLLRILHSRRGSHDYPEPSPDFIWQNARHEAVVTEADHGNLPGSA
jgi:hypothetical protein